jgi:hypothetical protein
MQARLRQVCTGRTPSTLVALAAADVAAGAGEMVGRCIHDTPVAVDGQVGARQTAAAEGAVAARADRPHRREEHPFHRQASFVRRFIEISIEVKNCQVLLVLHN